MDLQWLHWALLVVTGLAAGVINTLAGGGSNLTLPALMLMGMPAEVANASNRVGIFLQCLTGIRGFKKHDKLPTDDLPGILLPMMLAGLVGAAAASYAPAWIIKYLLLGAMLAMATVMLVSPSAVIPDEGSHPHRVADYPKSWPSLLLAGFYGGFVQAGVGFVLIAALAGSLRYDLVRANALKLVCTLAFTAVALVLFIARGQVLWLPALILAGGYIVGAQLGVKLALQVSSRTLKWFLFVMTLVGCAAALWFG